MPLLLAFIMVFIPRSLDLGRLVAAKSAFLLGPRQTGKSTLIRKSLPGCRAYNLLHTDVFVRLSQRPSRLREELQADDSLVVIDEVQKLPILLDEVQSLIDERGLRFLLTGSSARRLFARGVNLLGGRARIKTLHPLTWKELGSAFALDKALGRGLLPSIYFSDDPRADLDAYLGQYLKEEIAAEAAVRNLPAFSRFLPVAGLSNGRLINYANIANDSQVPRATVQEYFQILRDTLIGVDLPAWKRTAKRKPISTSKFFFFDVGVAGHLQQRRHVAPGTPEFGELFEAFFHHELRTFCDYAGPFPLHYWRSTSGFEVDFILDDRTAIEIKAKTVVGDHDLRGLKALCEETTMDHAVVASLETVPRRVGRIEILPWQLVLERLWDGDLTR
jgi:predicted AAA+ superfamily ATPase